MTVKDYEGDGIVVHWDAERCIHSGLCVQGSPGVFDPKGRPWVTPAGAEAGALAATIDTCPSGALSYTRTDGGAHGRRGHTADEDPTAARRADGAVAPEHPEPEQPAAQQPTAAVPTDAPAQPVSVTPRRDGPIVVEGPFSLIDDDGAEEVLERVFLCRCGESSTKPRCDGTHKRVGFTADGVDVARK